MAINLCADTVEVFKFRETGIVALCQEVVWFIQKGYDMTYNLNLNSARFVEDENYIKVVFSEKK